MHWCASVFIGLAHPVIVRGEGDVPKSDVLTKRQDSEDDEASQEEKDRELNEIVDGKSHYDDVDEDPSEMTREELAAKIGQARNEFARIPSASSIGWDTFPPLPNIGPPQIPGMQMQMQPRPPGQTGSACCGSKPKPPSNGWQPPNNGWRPPQPSNNNGWQPPQPPNNNGWQNPTNGWRPPNNGWLPQQPPNNNGWRPPQPPNNGWLPQQPPNNNGWRPPNNGWLPQQPPNNNGWRPSQPPANNGWLPQQPPNNNGWQPPTSGWNPPQNNPPYQPPYQPPSGFPPGYPSLYPNPPSDYYRPPQPQGPGNNYPPSYPPNPFYPPPDFQGGNYGFPPSFGFYPPYNPFGPTFPYNPSSRSISTSPLYPNPPFNDGGSILGNVISGLLPFRRKGGWDDTSDDHSDMSTSQSNMSWLQTILGQQRLRKSIRTPKMDTFLFPSELPLKQTKIT
ncbi:basic salivary proline-rich protein 1 isoform X2 [Folsomia candida]|uniref:basic salivary proline-rich protein 1 isoform X2 n=1 Tax=Folsomia candida TaxID=158441 RepID=UPI00160519C8|nr:basic salivary proline-rich protein 1 isoform X2 [Folsomia candida]